MIDEKKLIYDFQTDLSIGRYGEYTDGSEYAFTSREVLSVIERQPKVAEWIPVSERLPETGQMVLVTEKNSEYVTCCCYEYFCGYGMGFFGSMGNVIAWMPLPEPYRKDVE